MDTSCRTAGTSSTTRPIRPGSSGRPNSAEESPTSSSPAFPPCATSAISGATRRSFWSGRARSGTAGAFLAAGAERFSQLNSLNQNIFSVQDNLSFGTGAHRVTVGTANEFYSFDNAFFQAKIGVWAFNSLDSLQAGTAAAFERVLATAARPDGPVANFKVQQLGLYAQDEWTPTGRLTLTAGLRMDVPFNDKPAQNPALAANPFLPINTADFPSGNVLWSPRVGFNFDPLGTGQTIIRGGAGWFTGRPPYVWLSNAFVGTGLEQQTLTCTGTTVPAFTPDPASQPTTCAGGGAATAPRPSPSYFVKDFKFPQTFRISLGADHRLPGGFVATVDLLYSKNVNQLYVQDANLRQGGQNAEGRFMYGSIGTSGTGAFISTPSRIAPASGPDAIGNAVLHTNSPLGRTYLGTIQIQKSFAAGFEINAGYTHANTKDAISLTSSQAFSNYQFATVDGQLSGRNLTTSAFNVPDKVTVSGTVNLPFRTSLSLIYLGRSGDPYGWTVNGDVNADGINGNDLPFIPADATQITLVDPTQFTALSNFIDSQSCLREARGGLLRRNACRNPWQNYLNARFGATIPTVGTPGTRAVARPVQRPQFHRSGLGPVQAGERVRERASLPQRRRLRRRQQPADLHLRRAHGDRDDGLRREPERCPGRCEPVALDHAAWSQVSLLTTG